MIHYHGTPLTPQRELEKMAGKHFCVSFANPQNADWCLKNGQSVMWDNGAFTSFTRGRPFDKEGFVRWLEPRIGHPHWAVVPDVIGGGIEEQREMLKDWPYPKEMSAPVWHLGLPIDYLLELCDEWPRVCFGSSAEYWKVGGLSGVKGLTPHLTLCPDATHAYLGYTCCVGLPKQARGGRLQAQTA